MTAENHPQGRSGPEFEVGPFFRSASSCAARQNHARGANSTARKSRGRFMACQKARVDFSMGGRPRGLPRRSLRKPGRKRRTDMRRRPSRTRTSLAPEAGGPRAAFARRPRGPEICGSRLSPARSGAARPKKADVAASIRREFSRCDLSPGRSGARGGCRSAGTTPGRLASRAASPAEDMRRRKAPAPRRVRPSPVRRRRPLPDLRRAARRA